MPSTSSWAVQDFGLSDYESVWALQKRLVTDRLHDRIPDTLLIGEHPPVITLGRGSHAENLLNPSIPVIAIERGGDVTYHGPGQLIAYPIVKLEGNHRDLHRFLRLLEDAIIGTLAEFHIEGERNPGWTGVWVLSPCLGQRFKVASIGVAVKQWVTYHGLALNVSTDLAAFRQINPCGLESAVMTSMQALTGAHITVETVKPVLIRHLAHIFGGRAE